MKIRTLGLIYILIFVHLFGSFSIASASSQPQSVQPETENSATESVPLLADGHNLFLPAVQSNKPGTFTGKGDWPMAGANPQRTSWTLEEVNGFLKPEWFTHFDAYISQKIQIIAADNKLFIAASDGLHALDSNSGQELWFFPTDLPLGNAPTFVNKILYVGGFDHRVYAINANTGREIWRFQAGAGFETNPLVVNGIVYAGNRDNNFYAISASSGDLLWSYETGGPVLFSAAYKNGMVFFASNDMRAYALDAANGAMIWRSAKLVGNGFHSWWPVIYGDYVVFSGSYNYRYPGPYGNVPHQVQDQEAYAGVAPGNPIGPYGMEPWLWASGTRTMNASRISQYTEAEPDRRTTFVLRISDGTELTYDSDSDGRSEYAPFLFFGTHSGSRYPGVVGPDGVLYQANSYIADSSIQRGHLTGWKIGTTIVSIPTREVNAVDEPIGYAIGGNTVYWKRCCDRKAGSFNLVNGTSVNYYDEGGMRLRLTFPGLFEAGWDFSAWKHGDTTPPIPYNGRVYVIANNAVVAFSKDGKNPTIDGNDTGRNTGVPASNFEDNKTTFTGLNTKIAVNPNSWPLLYQQERYYEIREDITTRATHFSLFDVTGSVSGTPTSMSVSRSNISTNITSTFSDSQHLTTSISIRTPTILFQNTSTTYQLRGHFAAFAYRTSAGTQIRSGSATINGSDLNESWLLAWDGTYDHRWMPVVLSLQFRPTQIRLDSTGLTLTYSSGAGYLAVTPLYGMSNPTSSEANTWLFGIPQSTIDRIRLLNSTAHVFPTSSTDFVTINDQSGDAEWTYTYQYTTFTDSWNTSPLQLAYLPTKIALAAWNGSPIQVNGAPYETITDLGFVTPIGRVGGAPNTNSVHVQLPGIANYWRNTPTTPGVGENDPLRNKLILEIQKILEKGNLLPAYGITGIWDAKAANRLGSYLSDYWHNPADTVYTLIRSLPLLPSEQQNQVKQYLQQIYSRYPLYSANHVGWTGGNTRDYFNLPPEVIANSASFNSCSNCNAWGFPQENYYAAWQYANTFNNSSTIFSAPNFGKNLNRPPYEFPQSLPYALNSQLAGMIGYTRLATGQISNTSLADLEKYLLDLFMLRAALSKYPVALEQTGFEYSGFDWAVRTYGLDMPDTLFVRRTIGSLWNQLSLYGYTRGGLYGLSGNGAGGGYVFGIDYVNLVPEVANFMHDYVGIEEEVAIAEHEQRTPYWFVSKSEEAAGEGVIQPIYETIALFNAKAMILDESRAELEQYLDAPATPVGDLYYIQKLIMVLEATNQ